MSYISCNNIVFGSYVCMMSLIQCVDCGFVAVKYLFFNENGFIHENLTWQTLKKIMYLV